VTNSLIMAIETSAPLPAPDGHPERSPQVIDELLADGSMVLFHLQLRTLMTLNPTAALVWEYCDGHHSEAAIIGELQSLFPEAAAIADSVGGVLRDLRAREMLRPPPAQP
jgi:hypothetical protein